MAQLTAKVAFHDSQCNGRCQAGDRCIRDAEAFVRHHIARGRVRLTDDDREELVAEGLRIVTGLVKAYEPGRNGLDPKDSKLAGYVSKFLGGKLSDAWNRMQENARVTTQADGSRKWHYDAKASSLDAMMEAGTDHIGELQVAAAYKTEFADTLALGLDARWPRELALTVRVGKLWHQQVSFPMIAERLQVTAAEVAVAIARIVRAIQDGVQGTLADCLDRRWRMHDRGTTIKFGALCGLGYSASQAAEALRATEAEMLIATYMLEKVFSSTAVSLAA